MLMRIKAGIDCEIGTPIRIDATGKPTSGANDDSSDIDAGGLL